MFPCHKRSRLCANLFSPAVICMSPCNYTGDLSHVFSTPSVSVHNSKTRMHLFLLHYLVFLFFLLSFKFRAVLRTCFCDQRKEPFITLRTAWAFCSDFPRKCQTLKAQHESPLGNHNGDYSHRNEKQARAS